MMKRVVWLADNYFDHIRGVIKKCAEQDQTVETGLGKILCKSYAEFSLDLAGQKS